MSSVILSLLYLILILCSEVSRKVHVLVLKSYFMKIVGVLAIENIIIQRKGTRDDFKRREDLWLVSNI